MSYTVGVMGISAGSTPASRPSSPFPPARARGKASAPARVRKISRSSVNLCRYHLVLLDRRDRNLAVARNRHWRAVGGMDCEGRGPVHHHWLHIGYLLQTELRQLLR